jgi:thiosulfate/3-mercaptopyruvate sulfurtransferase
MILEPPMADASSLETLVDPDWVHRHLDDPSIALLDARYNLMDAEEGHKAYLDGHLPGAVYVHLSEDLSGPPVTDEGRHPLPTP